MLRDEQNVIRLMNQEMTTLSPFTPMVPDHVMAVHSYFCKLFLAYAVNMAPFAAKLLSFFAVLSFFDLALYPRILGQVLECDMENPENILHA